MPINLLNSLKTYLRLDDDELPESELKFLKLLIEAAIKAAEEAGIEKPQQANSLYEMLIMILASHWYTNRGIITYGNPNYIPNSANFIIGQLRGKR